MAYTKGSYNKPATQVTEAKPAEAGATAATASGAKPTGSVNVQDPNDSKKLIKLSGLWKNTTKNGKVYYKGNAENGDKFVVFID